VGIIAIDAWWERVGGRELRVFAVFVHKDYTSILEECHKCVFGTRDPSDLLDGCWIDGALIVS
jgi:hypothetical protein